ncbi:TetR/AcrR family transcriptional regulator [Acidicapsa ligni]|uniref:TetR/AcrR family transcriptional regulator n=1 Tax=Acidicapsa ligni TaxID=542300 RepID=UPI0021DFC83E|nr:TetR/AcrR family transcriptional regulator [Acidicapsa ligni]
MPLALDVNEKKQIVHQLFTVFRDRGFEGASLADLSRATGLGKSSLYHHFPGGKAQMVEAVLAQVKAAVQEAISEVADSPESLSVRVRKIVEAIEIIYEGGKIPCVPGKLAGSSVCGKARKILSEVFDLWLGAIADLARDSGMSAEHARHFSEDWVAQMQGAFVLYAANGNTGPFERACASLEKLARCRSKLGGKS